MVHLDKTVRGMDYFSSVPPPPTPKTPSKRKKASEKELPAEDPRSSPSSQSRPLATGSESVKDDPSRYDVVIEKSNILMM